MFFPLCDPARCQTTYPMSDSDAKTRILDNAYVASFFVQIACLVGCFVAFVFHFRGYSIALVVSSVALFVGCVLFQRYVKRWFRRRWPIGGDGSEKAP